MRSEKKESSGFPLRILVRDEMRVLCDVSDVHPLAERAEGKSIASMSAMEFARMLDTASPQELRALAGTGLRKKGDEKRRREPSPLKRQQSFEERHQTFQVNPDSSGARGWGAFCKASSCPTVYKIVDWARRIGPGRICAIVVGWATTLICYPIVWDWLCNPVI